MKMIQKMLEGPVDIVGDVHGEIDALDSLLGHLGYDWRRDSSEGRRLVFVGDLTDRGPDSPAVVDKVRCLVEAGRAQCVIGNHELSLLRHVEKHANSWYVKGEPDEWPTEVPDAAEKERIGKFLKTLPMVLERDDLRVVHACWHAESIESIRKQQDRFDSVAEFYKYCEGSRPVTEEEQELTKRKEAEVQEFGHDLCNPDWQAKMLPANAEWSRRYQMSNPVRVVTSGEEAIADTQFFSAGKWRMLNRVRWWDQYKDGQVVVFGHYWRWSNANDAVDLHSRVPYLFDGFSGDAWLGARRNAFCVDFRVAGRPDARKEGKDTNKFRLAALRTPEWQVFYDDGEWGPIGVPGRS